MVTITKGTVEETGFTQLYYGMDGMLEKQNNRGGGGKTKIVMNVSYI